MKHALWIVVVMASPLAMGQGTAEPIADEGLVFGESQGLIVVEAEHFYRQTCTGKRAWYINGPVHSPRVRPDHDAAPVADAGGHAYVEALPDLFHSEDDPIIPGDNLGSNGNLAVLHYKVFFDEPGEYFVWTRLRSNDQEDNTTQAGIDGAWPDTAKILQSPVNHGAWVWRSENRVSRKPWKIGRASLPVAARGPHDVQFCMREDGEEFDRFILTRDPNYAIAEGVGPEPTVRQGTCPAVFALDAHPAPEPMGMLNPDGSFYGANVLYQVTDGALAMEAEDFYRQMLARDRMWHLVCEGHTPRIGPDSDPVRLEGASGGAYLELLPDARQKDEDAVNSKTSIHGTGGQGAVLSYMVHFDAPGTCYVWVRARATDGDDNTLHVGVDDTWPESGKKMTFKGRTWAWSNTQRDTGAKIAVEILNPGIHELKLSMREDGCEIDRIFLCTDKDKAPRDTEALPSAIRKGVMETWHRTRRQRMDTAFAYMPDHGIVVMEAESCPVTEGWIYKADGSGFAGFGYLEWGIEGQGIRPGQGVLRYDFDIAEPGTYQLLIRGRIKDPSNRPDTPDPDGNDVWARFSGGTDAPGQRPLGTDWNKIAILGHPAGWTWNTNADPGKPHPVTPACRYFEKGTHTLELCGRSQGHAIDRIALIRCDNGPVTDFEGEALAEPLARPESRRRSQRAVTPTSRPH
ncbi:MAG: hypothetical protein ACOY3P_14410 [Planctomycetota bacterium]